MRPAPTLARRLGLAISGMMTAAVLFIAGGSMLIDLLIEADIKSRLSVRLRSAVEQLEMNRLPSNEDMLAIMKLGEVEEPRALVLSYAGLILLSLVAIAVGAAIGAVIARRLATPIAAVAAGARRIAGGDFSHRIAGQPKQTREIQSLIASFNAQARALERSDRQMRFHTAAVAHELRTPLTVLRGYVHGALDGVFPRDDAHMRALLTQVEDLSRLVDDLRTVSLASSDALSLEIAACDLAAEVRTVLAMARPQFAAAGMSVEEVLLDAQAAADPVRVRQMLLAVLDNARRYAAEGGCVTVRTERLDDVSILQVADRGPGLPAGCEARVFERFWRADPSRTRSTGGSGLGLAVVKALADAHGGAVEARNRRGGGALIELRFPHVATSAQTPEQTQATMSRAAP